MIVHEDIPYAHTYDLYLYEGGVFMLLSDESNIPPVLCISTGRNEKIYVGSYKYKASHDEHNRFFLSLKDVNRIIKRGKYLGNFNTICTDIIKEVEG